MYGVKGMNHRDKHKIEKENFQKQMCLNIYQMHNDLGCTLVCKAQCKSHA